MEVSDNDSCYFCEYFVRVRNARWKRWTQKKTREKNGHESTRARPRTRSKERKKRYVCASECTLRQLNYASLYACACVYVQGTSFWDVDEDGKKYRDNHEEWLAGGDASSTDTLSSDDEDGRGGGRRQSGGGQWGDENQRGGNVQNADARDARRRKAGGAGVKAKGEEELMGYDMMEARARLGDGDVVVAAFCGRLRGRKTTGGSDGDDDDDATDIMPDNTELRRVCDVLIYVWHQEELEQSSRNVFLLVDQGRVRRRFGNDWAAYFRFRLERFPAIPLMLLASLSGRPRSFYLESYERRRIALGALHVSLEQHEAAANRGNGLGFSSAFAVAASGRCNACNAMREAARRTLAAMEKKKEAGGIEGSGAVRLGLKNWVGGADAGKNRGSQDDDNDDDEYVPTRNGRLKRVTSLPTMPTQFDSNASSASSLSSSSGQTAPPRQPRASQRQPAPSSEWDAATPEKGPEIVDRSSPMSQVSSCDERSTGEKPHAGNRSRAAGKARLFLHKSLNALGQLIGGGRGNTTRGSR